jgi:hypothetical protein
MKRNFKEILAKLDWQAQHKLTREQCLEILSAPHKAKLEPFADRFHVSIALVRHVRYKCRAMLQRGMR